MRINFVNVNTVKYSESQYSMVLIFTQKIDHFKTVSHYRLFQTYVIIFNCFKYIFAT